MQFLAEPRHVLVDCGDYELGNLGDVAMLQVTVQRLQEHFPTASIDVITRDPVALARHCPGAHAVSYEGRQLWFGRGVLLGRADRVLQRTSLFREAGIEGAMRRHCAPVLERLVRARLGRGSADREAFITFMNVLRSADAVVVCGAGGITDHARKWALPVLALLEHAHRHGVPTAMFSHGLGPLTDPDLTRVAARVLPTLDLFALREGRAGPEIARALGVNPSRLMVTGDDAIDLAHAVRAEALGDCVGVNLRVARSAEVDERYIDTIGRVVSRFAAAHDAPLAALPIGRGKASDDVRTIERMLAAAGASSTIGGPLETTQAVIERAGRCRIVVTGAYHAAVFALAQGVSTVCLARSNYFREKLLGLAAQFGVGCTVIDLSADDVADQLERAMEYAWESAPSVRQSLLGAASRQIAASRSAYRRFSDLLAERATHGVRGARVSGQHDRAAILTGVAVTPAAGGGE
ncbi:MAG TPA: polysaccharide pyruvyl transferase family protein [Gemmatimonadaceae bacterium]|jgi:colanic acid/amylovoran biosynthesis protein